MQRNQEHIEYLLSGAYDLHTHPAPSSFPRALNDQQLLAEADAAGMAGVMIKSHYGCTAARAGSLNLTGTYKSRAYGGLALNLPVGGLNPYAVENCLNLGGTIIWMPTRDAEHCLKSGHMPGDFFERQGLSILNEEGRLKPEVYDIMDVIKKYGAYLATGHLSRAESVLLCREGRSFGVNMILTHPEWQRTKLDRSIQAELASLGVLVEKNWINIAEGAVSAKEMAANIRAAGVSRTYLATDRGQKGEEHPVEGMKKFISVLLNEGFTEKEIGTMIKDVPEFIANKINII